MGAPGGATSVLQKLLGHQPIPAPKKPPARTAKPAVSRLDPRAIRSVAGAARPYSHIRNAEPDPVETRFGNDMSWLDPAFQQRAQLAHSDPGEVARQNAVLDDLMGIAHGGGATALEKERRAAARAGEDQWIRGQRDADTADLAERGMAGSGAAITSLLGGQQQAGNRLASAGLETDAALEQRALDAMTAGGGLATTMRNSGDNFAALNANAINSVNQGNVNYLRQAQQHTQDQRYDNYNRDLDRKTGVASNLMGYDQAENQTGYQQGTALAGNDTAGFNGAKAGFNSTVVNPQTSGAAVALAGQNANIEGNQAGLAQFGQAANDLVTSVAGGGKGAALANVLGQDKEKK
jgi:hypothetical protein